MVRMKNWELSINVYNVIKDEIIETHENKLGNSSRSSNNEGIKNIEQKLSVLHCNSGDLSKMDIKNLVTLNAQVNLTGEVKSLREIKSEIKY